MGEASVSVQYLSAEEALPRLSALLPLAARQTALEPATRALHQTILRALASGAEPLNVPALAEAAAIADPFAALAQLRSADLIVSDRDGAVVGAYPVTLETTPHRVWLDGRSVHAMCAVDALAVGPLFGRGTRIESSCHACGALIAFEQDDEHITPVRLLNDVHIGVAWQATCGCAAHSLCREMVFFCGASHAAGWQGEAPEGNAVLSLPQAIRLAKAFFQPLLAGALSGK